MDVKGWHRGGVGPKLQDLIASAGPVAGVATTGQGRVVVGVGLVANADVVDPSLRSDKNDVIVGVAPVGVVVGAGRVAITVAVALQVRGSIDDVVAPGVKDPQVAVQVRKPCPIVAIASVDVSMQRLSGSQVDAVEIHVGLVVKSIADSCFGLLHHPLRQLNSLSGR